MRWLLVAAGVAAAVLAGCATGHGGTGIPDEEAIYDMPLEEVWPSVRQFFTDNQLSYREDKGTFVLETEWREEFGGSRVSGFWHRYMVVGKRETPSTSKLWVYRITRSANCTLASPARRLGWGVSRSLGSPGGRRRAGGGWAAGTGGRERPEQQHGGHGRVHEPAARRERHRGRLEGWAARLGDGVEGVQCRRAQAGKVRRSSWQAGRLGAGGRGAAEAEERARAQRGHRVRHAHHRPVAAGEARHGDDAGRAAWHPGGAALRGAGRVPDGLAGTPVTVGLELPVENQERVHTFLAQRRHG